MKFSEAIRLGATLKPQIYGRLANEYGTCAWGAAYDAIGMLVDGGVRSPNPWLWVAKRMEVGCPEFGCSRREPVAAHIITHLNDDHHWTREAIADWVATVEPQEQEAAAPQAELEEVKA